MKLTFLVICIFAFEINENLADVMVPDCKQWKKCNGYAIMKK